VSGQKRGIAVPQLVATHGKRVYNLGLRMCGNPRDAEDLVQETFLQAFRKWDQFEGRSKPSTWLYTIAARLCQRRRRRRAGEPDRLDSLEEILTRQRDVSALRAREADPLQGLLRKEKQRLAESAITRLPSSFRLPLLLKELAGLPVAEIAAVLDIKEATVKTRIHRARLFLAREIAGLSEGAGREAHPSHGRQACLELVRAKQDALDRGARLQVTDDELCDRCRMLFRSLDLASSACQATGKEPLPSGVRDRTNRALRRSLI
jgi:RNA polymerase sigma-70 factor, ECF subfamily